MIWTKNEYSRLVKFPILPQNSKISKSFQHALEVIINIVDINLQVPITYRFRNLTYLVILTKNVYLRLVKFPFFNQKSKNFRNRFNMRKETSLTSLMQISRFLSSTDSEI